MILTMTMGTCKNFYIYHLILSAQMATSNDPKAYTLTGAGPVVLRHYSSQQPRFFLTQFHSGQARHGTAVGD